MKSDIGTTKNTQIDFKTLYSDFDAPICIMDCGTRCAPYNALGVPFCCDIQQTIPTAFLAEWSYLRSNTDLWKPWLDQDLQNTDKINGELPSGQVPLMCLGADRCQRDFRTITCRAFPFFPYLTSQGEFLGLAYYWEFEDRCWIISNLHVVDRGYILQFVATFKTLLNHYPQELHSYQDQSDRMRRTFDKEKRSIIIFRHDGRPFQVNPGNERMYSIEIEAAPKFGPYKIASQLPFPDEIQDHEE